jgi:tRNA/rRNA methyltransferase
VSYNTGLPHAPEFGQVTIVLVSSRNPLNIGAAARAMSNFGFGELRVVNPYGIAFREARSAVGAPSLLAKAKEYKSVADAVADCSLVVGTTAARDRELQHPLRDLRPGARLIRRQARSGRVGLLFGSEKRGLSNHDLSFCHWLLRSPTREQHPSMNLGQAVAVCLYELARSSPVGTGKAELELASGDELERMSGVLLETLELSGYVQKSARSVSAEKLRRLLRRERLSSEDAQLWLGMLRQISWKLKNVLERGANQTTVR